MYRFCWVLCLLLCSFVCRAHGTKRPKTEVEHLEAAIKRTPGEMDLWCALAAAQLTAGDTIGAEKNLSYSMKIEETPCLYMHKARICVARQNVSAAARYAAIAVKKGLRPSEDSSVYCIDSLSRGGVMLCIKRMVQESKNNSFLWYGLGQLTCMYGDTIAALPYYETAYHLGDSTAAVIVAQLRAGIEQQPADEREMIAEIPYTYQAEMIELKGRLNGLNIRMIVDTTVTQSTISGVETLFMLKNEYITKDDIRDNTVVMVKRLELTETVHLDNVMLQYMASQESPVVLCLRDLKRLGRVSINEQKRVIEITK